jgi:hypothetical protein
MTEIDISVGAAQAVLESLKHFGYTRVSWPNQDADGQNTIDGAYKVGVSKDPLVIWPSETEGRKRVLVSMEINDIVISSVQEYVRSMASPSNITDEIYHG